MQYLVRGSPDECLFYLFIFLRICIEYVIDYHEYGALDAGGEVHKA